MNMQERIKKLKETDLSNLFSNDEEKSFNNLFNKKVKRWKKKMEQTNDWLELRKDFLRQFLVLISKHKNIKTLYDSVFEDLTKLQSIPKT